MRLTKQEARAGRKKQKLEEKLQQTEKTKTAEFGKKIAISLIAGVVVLGIIVLLAGFLNPAQKTKYDTRGISFPVYNVHWHAVPKIFICGAEKLIPTPESTNHLLHTHDDRLLHIEGTVYSPEEITLGKFFKEIGVNFSSTELWDKKNGDSCPNKTMGKVSMKANGLPNSEFENFMPKDGDMIELKFE